MTASLTAKAKNYCAEHKLRFTDPRKHVLAIMGEADKPLGAYDVLKQLGMVMDNPHPPTAYRAIDFWVRHGFAHRIESLNAYVACGAGHQHKGSQYLICTNCSAVEEIHLCSLPQKLSQKVSDKAFVMEYWNAEIHGLCANCQA